MSLSYIKQAGYSTEDVEKQRIPCKLETITNGFIYEAIKFFDNNVIFIDYIARVTGNQEYKDCNQKSLRKKIFDMVAMAKKKRRNKDTKFQLYLSQEFKPPVRSHESREVPSRNALIRENEALKKRLENMEGDYDDLQAKYEEAMRKLKRLGH